MYFIAEVSSNHAQDLERCIDFVKASADAGCDAVKFQLFEVEKLFSPEVLEANPDVLERKKWEMPRSFFPQIQQACKEYNIDFGCTPFDLNAVDFLNDYVDFYKIASYELLWDQLILSCANTNKNLIISTGMASIEEVVHANDILKNAGSINHAFLHCVSAYPTPPKETNLSAIKHMRDKLNCKIGWSDHTVNPAVLYRAINKWGAEIIEFHIDLEGEGAEFSSGHCWLPDQIQEVISNIREGFECDGSGKKIPQPSEINDRAWRADPQDGLRPLKTTRNELKKK